MAETMPSRGISGGNFPPTAGQTANDKKANFKLENEPTLPEEPKPRKKRESVPVIVCRLENVRLVPLVDEENKWREFTSTGEADKWLKGDPKTQEGVEYFIFPVQRRVKFKFHSVRKITVES